MRTYYFCTDTAKDMEAWMKVMTGAALVQTELAKRLEKREANNVLNQQRTLTRPEAQKNARNREEQKAKDAERYGFRKDGVERPLTKISSIKLQPAQAAAIAAAVASSRRSLRVPQVNGEAPPTVPNQASRVLQRTNSMQQLEQWVRTHRGRGLDEQEGRSITSYQTLPRNMPSHHRAPTAPLYSEGYRTLPRNSVCSISPLYDRTLGPEKRRSMRDDTMWQLYEWQQRQAYGRQGAPYGTLPSPRTMVNLSEQAPPSIPTSPSHNSLCPTFSPHRSYTPGSEVSSPVFRGDATLERRHRPHLNKYAYPPDRRTPVSTSVPAQSTTAQSLQGKTPEELTLLLIKLRRQQAELNSVREHTLAQLMQLNLDAANPKNEILSHHLQRSLMYLDNQMKESEPLILAIHTMIENSAPRPQLYQQVSPDDYRDNTYAYGQEDLDVDAKLSRLCEQDKVVRMQEEKLQQLHREKHTLETALLSASQEIEMSADDPAAVQSVVQQRDVLQSGLLSTCRELARVTAELERSWREYDRLEGDVSLAKTNLLEQLEALGSPQTEPPSQQHVQIQKDLWRIQDVTEALSKNKPKRSTESTGFLGSKQISNKYKNEEEDLTPPRPPLPQTYDMSDRGPAASRHQTHRPGQRNGTHAGPDYRLYKSEPELTTVAEVDETNGEDKSEPAVEKEPSNAKAVSYPVGIVPPRTKSPLPESSTIASYVTLRKSKKPEPRMPDRPHSAVDQPCGTEAGRPRMSLEEQLERIRRNQEALLKDRKKSQESSPSRSSSFSKENPFLTLQPRKREDVLRIDTQDMHFSMENNEDINVEENISTHGESLQADEAAVPDQSEPLEPEETASPHEEDDKQKKVDRIITVANTNSPQNVNSSEVSSPEVDVESSLLDQEQMINTSYETSKLVSVKSLPSPPRSPPPTLPDGSHFMCV